MTFLSFEHVVEENRILDGLEDDLLCYCLRHHRNRTMHTRIAGNREHCFVSRSLWLHPSLYINSVWLVLVWELGSECHVVKVSHMIHSIISFHLKLILESSQCGHGDLRQESFASLHNNTKIGSESRAPALIFGELVAV